MIEISLVLALAAILVLAGVLLRRAQAGAAAIWLCGWTAAGTSGILVLAGEALHETQPLIYLLGSVFPWLLLAGSYELDQRPAPAWLVPAGVAWGLLRAAVAATVSDRVALALALPLEPAVAVAAAWVAWRATWHEGASLTQRLLGPTMLVLAALGAFHVVWMVLELPVTPFLPILWLAAAPLIVTEQIYAASERVRAALELRVAERTAELARANASLRLSEERYRTVSELSSDFSFAARIDPEWNLSLDWVTDAFQRITGVDPSELAGHGWRSFLITDGQRDLAAEEARAKAPGGTVVEQSIRTRSGEIRRLEIHVHALRSDLDGSLRVLGSARDVTEARLAQEERAQLERQVQELHRLESLGRLSGGVAHDFNNLLSVILGNVRLAQEDLPPDRALRGRLDRIRSAAEHAAKITDQMLVYAGRAQTVRKAFDLSSTLEGMEELLRASVPDGCELEVACGGRSFLEGDETQLRQVVLNLVANASEALPEGLGRVQVRTGAARLSAEDIAGAVGSLEAGPGEYVFLEVADSGPGMDGTTRKQVFEPFFSTKFTGRGMGLATVLGIVRAHRGVVQLETAPGRGTRVRVLLPSSRPAATAREASAAVAWPEPGCGRLLVVDDDPDVLEVAREFLARSGYEVATESGGRAGIARFAEDPGAFDAVILDVAMPDVGGQEAFRAMRRLRPELPVVLASGYSEEFTAERFPASGATAFLRKPYEPETLVAQVRRALSRSLGPG